MNTRAACSYVRSPSRPFPPPAQRTSRANGRRARWHGRCVMVVVSSSRGWQTRSSPWKRRRDATLPIHHPARILVAEDDPEMLTLIVEAFRKDGYEVQAAHDGGRLLVQLTHGPRCNYEHVDLIVSDVRMPICSGSGWENWSAVRSRLGLSSSSIMGMTTAADRPSSLASSQADSTSPGAFRTNQPRRSCLNWRSQVASPTSG